MASCSDRDKALLLEDKPRVDCSADFLGIKAMRSCGEPQREARECPAGTHRSRRTAAAALAVGPGRHRAQMASSPPQPGGTCPRQHLLQEGTRRRRRSWAWTPAWPCLGSSLPDSFLLSAPPVPHGQSPSQRGDPGHGPGSGWGIVSFF